ncbi:MAG TPA: RNA methyltransferase [Beutenbergiaceae bacterium]|nr:RNA methyltransferase [Beutenbergiaceae bacterium]
MTPDLTAPRAPRVRKIRSLTGRSVRSRQGRFLIEGPQGVRSALRHRPEWIQEVYLTPQAAQRHRDVADLAHQTASDSSGIRVLFGTDEVLQAMSPDAQGVLAVGTITAEAPRGFDSARLLAFLHQVRDPGNAGTVIRAADAAGADSVVLSAASVELHNPKTVRSTAGSMFHLPVATGADLEESVRAARAAGVQVLAADGSGRWELDDLADAAAATPPAAAGVAGAQRVPDLRRPTMWVFGNEAHGLGRQEMDLADAVVRISLRGHAESLNLAMAATLCLFASARAQR